MPYNTLDWQIDRRVLTLTLNRPVRLHNHDARRFSVTGTPTDAVTMVTKGGFSVPFCEEKFLSEYDYGDAPVLDHLFADLTNDQAVFLARAFASNSLLANIGEDVAGRRRRSGGLAGGFGQVQAVVGGGVQAHAAALTSAWPTPQASPPLLSRNCRLRPLSSPNRPKAT